MPVSYDDDAHPYTDLVAGRVDAVLLDHVIAERSLRVTARFVIQPEAVATGHYVGVLAQARTRALRDSVNAILRARMRDGSLERTFRAWNVWDDAQARALPRVLARARRRRERAQCRDRGRRRRHALARVPRPRCCARRRITLVLSCLAMALAVALGIADRGGARVRRRRSRAASLTVYVEVMRGTPVLLQLFVLYYGLSGVVRLPAFVAAVLGLGLNYAAYESEIYRAALEAIPRAQLEAARTLGLSRARRSCGSCAGRRRCASRSRR